MLAVMFCTALSGCGQKDTGGYVYYYIDEEGTALESASCDVSGDSAEEVAEALIGVLNEADSSCLLPEDAKIIGYTLTDRALELNFSAGYYEMDTVRELLCRAAVVETMLQIDALRYVGFTVAGDSLTDEEGEVVGWMSEDTFITNPVSQINSLQKATVVLYYTDSSGQMLYPEQRTVHYFSSMSIEWMVVEQLINGPQESSLAQTIPAETSIISVTSADGICYVNLDQAFQSNTFSVTAEIVVYSIVNSLCELSWIDSVQISVDGASDIIYRDTVDLSQNLTQNPDLIADNADPVETEVDTEGE